jgi:uncharacterized protein (DUF1697 family)
MDDTPPDDVGAGATTFVALLRGVNVGKAKRVPMAAFRDLLGDLGYTHVATLLNSGNAVFRATGGAEEDHERRIEAALEAAVGVRAAVIVKTARVLAAIVDEDPLRIEQADASRSLVAFTRDRATLAAWARAEHLVVPPERFAIGAHAAYLVCPGGLLECEAAKALLGPAKGDVTTRNWATTCKLRALADRVDAAAA